MVWENMNGIMDNPMRATGKMGKRMALEFGDRQMVIVIKANGQVVDNMDKELINTKQVFSKDNFRRV